jgi:hypothetical protein
MPLAKALFLVSLALPLLATACSTQPNALDRLLGQAPDQQNAAAYQQGRRDQMQQDRYYGQRNDGYNRPAYSGYGY